MAFDTAAALRAGIVQLITVAVRLPLPAALLGAVLAGIPSAVATVIGAHWLGALIAIVCFALWCGGLAARRMEPI